MNPCVSAAEVPDLDGSAQRSTTSAAEDRRGAEEWAEAATEATTSPLPQRSAEVTESAIQNDTSAPLPTPMWAEVRRVVDAQVMSRSLQVVVTQPDGQKAIRTYRLRSTTDPATGLRYFDCVDCGAVRQGRFQINGKHPPRCRTCYLRTSIEPPPRSCES